MTISREGTADIPSFGQLPTIADTGERHDWGVFGDQDELGTINFLTPESVLRAAGLVRSGLVVDLSLPLNEPSVPLGGGRAVYEHVVAKTRGGRDDMLNGFYLQGSTQWDSLQHIRYREFGYYGGREEEELDSGTLGVDRLAHHGIVGRGLLIDFAEYCAAHGEQLVPDQRRAISSGDMERVLEWEGVELLGGDILLVRTGWLQWYLSLDKAEREAMMGTVHTGEGGLECVGLDPTQTMAAWLWDRRVAAVATDNHAVEALPVKREEGYLHRRLLPLLGMPLGEWWNLEDLSVSCRNAGRYEFLFVSVPLKIPAGVGSPGNGVAIL